MIARDNAEFYLVMKSRFVAFVAIIVAAYVSFGYLAMFHLARVNIRAEARALLRNFRDDSKLVQFHFSAEKWRAVCPGGHEFSVNGEMYDVKTANLEGGHYRVIAYHDSDESELMDNFGSMLSDHHDETTPVRYSGLLKMFGENFLSEHHFRFFFPLNGFLQLAGYYPVPASQSSAGEVFSPPKAQV